MTSLADGATDLGDTITGSQQEELLYGFDGDDTILGIGGDDVLVGGRGNDLLQTGQVTISTASAEVSARTGSIIWTRLANKKSRWRFRDLFLKSL